MVDRAVSEGVLPGPVVAQSGASRYRPRSFSASRSLSPDEVSRALERSRYVVCHGGAAMVAAAIAAGRRPLVLPRDRAAGEHRTEHQAQLVARLAAAGAAVALRDAIRPGDLRAADKPWSDVEIGSEWPSVEAVLSDEAEAALRG